MIDTKKRSLQMMHVCLLEVNIGIFSVVIMLDILELSVSPSVGPVWTCVVEFSACIGEVEEFVTFELDPSCVVFGELVFSDDVLSVL